MNHAMGVDISNTRLSYGLAAGYVVESYTAWQVEFVVLINPISTRYKRHERSRREVLVDGVPTIRGNHDP